MATRPLPPEQLLAMLAAGPPRIAAATAGVADERLRAAPGEGEWPALEVLAHLRACADMWGDAIAAILASERPTLRAINPQTWIEKTDYREQPFEPSLRAFERQRAALLTTLESLEPDAWQRTASVTGAGKPLERSVHFYAQWLATHERAHVKKIERMAKEMRDQP